MGVWRRLESWLSWFPWYRRRAREADLARELRGHLELEAEEQRAAGLSPEEAGHAAHRALGNELQVEEDVRAAWGFMWVETLLQDFRYGLRMLRKSPGFAAIAILTLALGIGANTTIFSVVDGILLRPLPYPDAGRLVSIWGFDTPKGIFPAIRDASRTMHVAAYSWNSGVNLTRQGETVHVMRTEVSANLFRVLGVRAALGRTFRPGEDTPPRDRVAILSHTLWQERFGADPHVVGESVVLDDLAYRIVGVMPTTFRFPSSETALWIPIEITPATMWGNFAYTMVGRLRNGVSLSEARAEFKTLVPRAVKLLPWKMPRDWGSTADVLPLQGYTVGDVRAKLLILLSAVGLVLLIACSNVASLLIGRASGRRREIAVRAALGASRVRIIRQLLTESVSLALIGGGLGVALAFRGLALLKTLLPENTPRLADVGINWQVLAFTSVLVVAAGVLFGLAPALSASKLDLERELKTASGRTGPARSQRRVSSVLVVAEVALEVMVVVGSALLLRSLWTLSQRDPGFDPTRILTAHVDQIPSHCKGPEGCVNFYNAVLQRISAIPGVRAAGAAGGVPGSGFYSSVFSAEEHLLSINGTRPLSAWELTITPGYLRAMGMTLLRGRAFTEADRAGSQPVVLISAAAARHWWPHKDPIGKRIKPSWMHQWRTVVGVVGDVRESGLANPPPGEARNIGAVYFPYAQGIVSPGLPPDLTLVIQARGNPASIASDIRHGVASVEPDVPVTGVRTMDGILSASIATPRSTTWLFVSFGALALVLGTIGVYGVVSGSVTARVREIGIRIALGATKSDVLKMVVKDGLRLAAVGTTVGLLCALAMNRLMSSLLFGIRPDDMVAFLAAPAITLLVAAMACYLPARRAMHLDPVTALRNE